MGTSFAALRWVDPPDGPAVALLDQTRLPGAHEEIVCTDVRALIAAIRRLVVRGAPLLGVAGAYGVALAAARDADVPAAARELADARPTAVNLAWGVHTVARAFDTQGASGALAAAHALADADAAACVALARNGLPLVGESARILTHCNTGALVTMGEGTALGVVRAAHRAGRLAQLWITETRPLLQGARLTADEAARAGLPHTLLPDGAAASLFARGEVDLVLLGADRIAADGSVANKVGTYGLAVLARHHGIPFVVAAPTSTVDLDTPSGSDIIIEQRDPAEVTTFAGRVTAPVGTTAYNPAFDVTPPQLISALVSERGVTQPVDASQVARLCDRSRLSVKR